MHLAHGSHANECVCSSVRRTRAKNRTMPHTGEVHQRTCRQNAPEKPGKGIKVYFKVRKIRGHKTRLKDLHEDSTEHGDIWGKIQNHFRKYEEYKNK